MRGLLVACALALAVSAAATAASRPPAASACDPSRPGLPAQRTHHGNLDRDADLEGVVETYGGCPHQSLITLEDRCRGKLRFHRLPGRGRLARLDLVEANGRSDGRELLFGLWSAKRNARYRGNVGLVHIAPVAAGQCPRPVYLLSYFLRRPPPRAGRLTHLELLRLTRRVLRMRESFGAGRFRETHFRYLPREDRYVAYRMTTKA